MLKRVLTCIILALVVLQSGLAMGDAHQMHQSGAEHKIFDDNHAHPEDSEPSDLDAPSSQDWDCHHCCHCHGHLCPAILVTSLRLVLPKSPTGVLFYTENTPPLTVDTFLRPPIA